MTPPLVDASDPRDVLRLLRRRGWILLVCVIVIPAAVYLYSERLTKTYASTVIVEPRATTDPQAILSGGGSSGGNAAGVASLAQTASVAAEAARIEQKPISTIRSVNASSDDATGFVTIKVGGKTPLQAQLNARAMAQALGATRRDTAVKQIDDAIANVEQQLEIKTGLPQRQRLQDQLQQLRTVKGAQSQNVQVVDPPGPGSLVAPQPRRNALLALIAALLIGTGLMVLVERFDRKVRKPEELEPLAKAPLLGTIPYAAFRGGEPEPQVSEAFQTLRDSLTFFNIDLDLNTLVVVSPLKGEGKTTVVANLAAAFARADTRVVAVDCDLRHPQLASRFGIDNSPGLSQVLVGDPLESALHSVDGFEGRLQVLPGGLPPPNPSELLRSMRMASLLRQLANTFDLVLIDTAPLLVISDAFALLEQASGLVGVARLEQTQSNVVVRMADVAQTAGGRLLGMVATGARAGHGYGYGYGYGYGQAGAGMSSNGAAAEQKAGQQGDVR